MHTITFFANKGGSGRTIATMALASGFLALGKRVAVTDCSDLASHKSSPLRQWITQMAACKFRPPKLELIECQTREEVEDSAAAANARGVEVLLIDTSARIYEPQLVAFGLADLIVAPATGSFEAKCIVEGVSEHLGTPEHLIGLICGCRNGIPEAAETRAAFGYHSVFQSELPWAEALSDQILHGDIANLVSSITCKPGKPGYARYREAQAAWSEVLALTIEVQWALQGLRLEAFEGDTSSFSYIRKSVA